MRWTRREWRKLRDEGKPEPGTRSGRQQTPGTGREPAEFETRVAGKKVRVVALTIGEARATIKRLHNLPTTAGLIVVQVTRPGRAKGAA